MKKFFVFLLILMILGGGGAALYFGWMQRHLGELEYGVVHTRTGGYDEEVLEPGGITWRWDALIPKNLTVHVFDLSPRSSVLSIKGILPSGELYGQYMEGSPDFSYELTISINYTIRKERLPELVEFAGLTQEGLGGWYDDREQEILVSANSFLQTLFAQPTDPPHEIVPGGYREQLTQHLNSSVDHLVFASAYVVKQDMPDTILYLSARENYLTIMESRRTLEIASLEEATRNSIGQDVDLEFLGRLGELLTNYPALSDYFVKTPSIAEEFLLSGEQE